MEGCLMAECDDEYHTCGEACGNAQEHVPAANYEGALICLGTACSLESQHGISGRVRGYGPILQIVWSEKALLILWLA
jgi:hypothetical protein